MQLSDISKITTREEAQAFAQEWQQWASTQNLSYSELAQWQQALTYLAIAHNLVEEFEENAII